MPDHVAPEVRSRIMRAIRGRNTTPERTVRSFLHAAGLRFRIHCRDLPGKPDIVLPKYRSVVLVHGCFWHQHPGCVHSGIPLSNRAYWEPKLSRTVARDVRQQQELSDLGWQVHVIWECEITPTSLRGLLDAITGGAISE